MSRIQVTDLTFCYEESFDNIFERVSFAIDSEWKLGFIGRNGKGKTTFLKLLLGEYVYGGSISCAVRFDYFPYQISEGKMRMCASEFLEELKPGCEEWRVICELSKLHVSAELLYRPFETLSHGERTKVLLAVLFSGEHDFLLIDEPTNHLDQESRETVKQYLNGKKGFLLVSHDRDLLDACIDHVLVLNRKSIEVQNGNFSVWWENKNRRDHFAKAENERHLREIASLKRAVVRSGSWAEKNENTKIGIDPIKDHDRGNGTRPYIGAKTKKMQKRVQDYKKRIEREIEAREGLLVDVECPVSLKLNPLSYHKERLLQAKDLTVGYSGSEADALSGFSFELKRGERVFLHGKNGCGKSTFIKMVLEAGKGEPGNEGNGPGNLHICSGELLVGSGLVISYINQDTSFLKGSIKAFCRNRGLDESLFCALLSQLDMDRVQFTKGMEAFSEGQKKKVLIAASLMTPAHLYLWDEPLNYIDVFSRMQIEELLGAFRPTMVVVEHDVWFREKIATRVVEV